MLKFCSQNFSKGHKMTNERGLSKFFANGLDLAAAIMSKTPIASLVIGAIKAIVAKVDDGISNKSVIEVVKEMAKSTWNDLSEEKVVYIAEIVTMDEEKFAALQEYLEKAE